MPSQIGEHRIGVGSIYLGLCENGEVCFEVILYELFNFALASAFLVEKFIAGKRQNFETTAAKLVVHFDHFLVIW